MKNVKHYHIGLWRYARDFYYAATIINSANINSMMVQYYLYCHAIELVLKSALAYYGFDEKSLRRIGHDLIVALEEVAKNDPGIPNITENWRKIETIIRMINPYYKEKELEYIKEGMKRFPILSDMEDITKVLLRVIGERIGVKKPQLNKLLQRMR